MRIPLNPDFRLLLFVFFTLVASNAQSNCLTDTLGKQFCSPPLGTAIKTLINGIVCAPGECKVDDLGRIKCSSISGGGVAKNDLGQLYCLGGCINPSGSICIEMTDGDKK